MIEDKKLGLKIAENRTEALWERVRRESIILINQSEDNLIIQKEMLKLAEKMLKEEAK